MNFSESRCGWEKNGDVENTWCAVDKWRMHVITKKGRNLERGAGSTETKKISCLNFTQNT